MKQDRSRIENDIEVAEVSAQAEIDVLQIRRKSRVEAVELFEERSTNHERCAGDSRYVSRRRGHEDIIVLRQRREAERVLWKQADADEHSGVLNAFVRIEQERSADADKGIVKGGDKLIKPVVA